jgi:signal transduction histidine kinase
LDIIPKATESNAKINTIHRCAKEAASVAKQILIFSKKETSLMTSVCVKTTIEDFLKVIDAMRPPDVNIVLDIDEDCDPILANPTQISQLLVNLCTNALQAMPKKAGTLTISLKQISINAEVADQFSSLREGNYVRLSVSDTGHGIPKENIEKIFEPSFTTKKAGEGFGLGLASVRNIVKNHDGEIIVDSKTNHGTTLSSRHIILLQI